MGKNNSYDDNNSASPIHPSVYVGDTYIGKLDSVRVEHDDSGIIGVSGQRSINSMELDITSEQNEPLKVQALEYKTVKDGISIDPKAIISNTGISIQDAINNISNNISSGYLYNSWTSDRSIPYPQYPQYEASTTIQWPPIKNIYDAMRSVVGMKVIDEDGNEIGIVTTYQGDPTSTEAPAIVIKGTKSRVRVVGEDNG